MKDSNNKMINEIVEDEISENEESIISDIDESEIYDENKDEIVDDEILENEIVEDETPENEESIISDIDESKIYNKNIPSDKLKKDAEMLNEDEPTMDFISNNLNSSKAITVEDLKGLQPALKGNPRAGMYSEEIKRAPRQFTNEKDERISHFLGSAALALMNQTIKLVKKNESDLKKEGKISNEGKGKDKKKTQKKKNEIKGKNEVVEVQVAYIEELNSLIISGNTTECLRFISGKDYNFGEKLKQLKQYDENTHQSIWLGNNYNIDKQVVLEARNRLLQVRNRSIGNIFILPKFENKELILLKKIVSIYLENKIIDDKEEIIFDKIMKKIVNIDLKKYFFHKKEIDILSKALNHSTKLDSMFESNKTEINNLISKLSIEKLEPVKQASRYEQSAEQVQNIAKLLFSMNPDERKIEIYDVPIGKVNNENLPEIPKDKVILLQKTQLSGKSGQNIHAEMLISAYLLNLKEKMKILNSKDFSDVPQILNVWVSGTKRPCRGCYHTMKILMDKGLFGNINLHYGTRPGKWWTNPSTNYLSEAENSTGLEVVNYLHEIIENKSDNKDVFTANVTYSKDNKKLQHLNTMALSEVSEQTDSIDYYSRSNTLAEAEKSDFNPVIDSEDNLNNSSASNRDFETNKRFIEISNNSLQNGWSCGDIAINTTREELYKWLSEKANDAETRALLGPEICNAAIVSYSLGNLPEENERKKEDKIQALIKHLLSASEKAPSDYKNKLINNLNMLLDGHSKTNKSGYANQVGLPAAMCENINLFQTVEAYLDADNKIGPDIIAINKILHNLEIDQPIPADSIYGYDQLEEIFANEKYQEEYPDAYKFFQEVENNFGEKRRALRELCQSEHIYKEYINGYYHPNKKNWMAYQPDIGGTSIIDAAAKYKGAQIIVWISDDKEPGRFKQSHKTNKYGDETINILYNGHNHFMALKDNPHFKEEYIATSNSSNISFQMGKCEEEFSNEEQAINFESEANSGESKIFSDVNRRSGHAASVPENNWLLKKYKMAFLYAERYKINEQNSKSAKFHLKKEIENAYDDSRAKTYDDLDNHPEYGSIMRKISKQEENCTNQFAKTETNNSEENFTRPRFSK